MLDKKIIFWGSPLFSLPSLQVLFDLGIVAAVVTQADKPAGRNLKPQSSAVKIWAQEHNIKVLDPLKLDDNFILELKKLLPATFVIVAYGRIIKDQVLSLSELPAINIHPSLLPILRGPSPIQTTLLNGQKETGVSLMQLDAQMDHGPILAQVPVNIFDNDDYFTLSERLANVGADLLQKNISDYLAAKIEAKAQDDSKATICKLINKEDGLITWQETSANILNKIRAFKLWPGTYTKIAGLDLIISEAIITNIKLKPAEILIKDNKLFIGTQDFALEITKLKPANKKLMSAPEFIRGYQNKLK
jgi:methionyl-tRNA formyltransferase